MSKMWGHPTPRQGLAPLHPFPVLCRWGRMWEHPTPRQGLAPLHPIFIVGPGFPTREVWELEG